MTDEIKSKLGPLPPEAFEGSAGTVQDAAFFKAMDETINAVLADLGEPPLTDAEKAIEKPKKETKQ